MQVEFLPSAWRTTSSSRYGNLCLGIHLESYKKRTGGFASGPGRPLDRPSMRGNTEGEMTKVPPLHSPKEDPRSRRRRRMCAAEGSSRDGAAG